MRKWSWQLQNKDKIRVMLNAKRAAVTSDYRDQAARQAAHILLKNSLFENSDNIACYFARHHEFDCTPIINAVWETHKKCYLPVVSDLSLGQGEFLNFVAYKPEDKLQQNRYRILEPEHAEIFPAEQLDVVLLPLVAFDLQGNRLGMGKGYYDRTFAFMRNTTGKKPCLIGLAYELQQVDNLPHDVWDIPLSGVLTEKRFIQF